MTRQGEAELGLELYLAERERGVLTPITDRHPGLTVPDAYRIQTEYGRLRQERDGAAVVGVKVGCTSLAIQHYFGIDTPDFGLLLSDMRIEPGSPLEFAGLIQPKVEPELAFLLKADLAGPGVGIEDVLAVTGGVAPCLEVIDSRIEAWRIRLIDTIADNGSSARFVVGAPLPLAEVGDLSNVEVVFRRNDDESVTGTGADVLGHPALAVAWLANTLGTLGSGLRAGQTVLSGSFTSAFDARPGDRFHAIFSRAGDVSLDVV